MNVNEREYLDDLARRVIGAAYEVSNTSGAGFLEEVYERALLRELRLREIDAQTTVPLPVVYKEERVGEYFADILVEGKLIVELKCCDGFCDEHVAQCINYLKATGLTLALLINFQNPKVEWRKVFLNH